MKNNNNKKSRQNRGPHITGIITYGNSTRSHDRYHIDGPLYEELQKILEKYGELPRLLPVLTIGLLAIALYNMNLMMAGILVSMII